MAVKPIRDGYHTATPYLIVPSVSAQIDFLKTSFGASEDQRKFRPDGSVMHAELSIGDSKLMLGEPNDAFDPMPAAIYLYVENCDQVYQKAIASGGISVMEPTIMYHAGERYGGVKDPSCNIW